jgi:hypothetical protein
VSRTARALVGFILVAAGGLRAAATLSTFAGEDEWAVTRDDPAAPDRSSGGEFALRRLALAAASGGELSLIAAPSSALALSPQGELCFCVEPLFADGFESHDTSAWSLAVP